jgi:predicted nucleic acid-binding Zn ribbon protein
VRRAAPRPLRLALEAITERSAPAGLLAQVQSAWPDVAGSTIAGEAEPVSEREGTVTVACGSAAWAHELELLRGDLRLALNTRLGGERVRELRFMVRGP